MTSMLATSMTLAAAGAVAGGLKRAPASWPSRCSGLLGAVAWRGLLLGPVLGCGVLDDRLDDRIVAGEPVGDHVPLLAVPLVDPAETRALMVGARDLDRSDHALEAELLDAVGGEVEMLDAPAHLLAGHRLVAEL